jgi:hypothetical protein
MASADPSEIAKDYRNLKEARSMPIKILQSFTGSAEQSPGRAIKKRNAAFALNCSLICARQF